MKRYNKRDNDRANDMFEAVCADCGSKCQVPFKPTGGKPVYCSKCFEKYDEKGSDNRKPRRDSRSSSDRDMHSAICDKCGKDCKVPFKPTENKPVYCSDCFGGNDKKSQPRNHDTNEIEKMNYKLDKILDLLQSRNNKK
jgi:CxxC-x17-CxxC domain-containing protein